MTRNRLPLFALLACFVLTAAATPARAQASLGKAKELYASANYDEALSMLNALGSSNEETDAAAVAMYRVLCLVAVGRTGEVDTAIDRLVAQHPLYRPPSDEMSPRIQKAVSSARVRLLPSLVQRRYEESKTAYDRGDFAASSAGFKWVLSALSDPDISYLSAQSPLSDIKTLSLGFRDLSTSASLPPPSAPATAPPTIPQPAPPRIFSGDDGDVAAPVAERQTLPEFPAQLTVSRNGVLELVIDERGAVESAVMRVSMNPRYDRLVLEAARSWRYSPATHGGVPVKYRKSMQIAVKRAQ